MTNPVTKMHRQRIQRFLRAAFVPNIQIDKLSDNVYFRQCLDSLYKDLKEIENPGFAMLNVSFGLLTFGYFDAIHDYFRLYIEFMSSHYPKPFHLGGTMVGVFHLFPIPSDFRKRMSGTITAENARELRDWILANQDNLKWDEDGEVYLLRGVTAGQST